MLFFFSECFSMPLSGELLCILQDPVGNVYEKSGLSRDWKEENNCYVLL